MSKKFNRFLEEVILLLIRLLAPIGVAKPLGIHFWDDAPDVVNHLFVNDLCRVSLLRLIVP